MPMKKLHAVDNDPERQFLATDVVRGYVMNKNDHRTFIYVELKPREIFCSFFFFNFFFVVI